MHNPFPVFWLTGNTNAGKTTLAFGVMKYINEHLSCDSPCARRAIVLDGDDMRDTISKGKTLTPEDRRSHNLRVASLACLLRQQGHLVIVSVIAPFEDVRQEINKLCEPLWVYVHRGEVASADKPYEKPSRAALEIDNIALSQEKAREKLLSLILEKCGEVAKRS